MYKDITILIVSIRIHMKLNLIDSLKSSKDLVKLSLISIWTPFAELSMSQINKSPWPDTHYKNTSIHK